MAGLVGLTTALIQGPDSKKLPYAVLVPLDATGSPFSPNEFVFQFYPDTVEDNIQINWIDKDIPGLSHPLKQWVSNGGRTISFETIFSRDIMPKSDLPTLVGLVVNPASAENAKWNYDIRFATKALRMFCYPSYMTLEDGVSIATAPPVLRLTLQGMALGKANDDNVYVVMTGCDITYEAAFENGVPRRARVRLEFSEVIQVGTTIKSWDSANDFITTDFEDT